MDVLEKELNNAVAMMKRAKNAVEKAYWKGEYDVLKWILDMKEKGKKREEEGSIVIKMRWRDCFKFWISGFLFWLLLVFIILVMVSVLAYSSRSLIWY